MPSNVAIELAAVAHCRFCDEQGVPRDGKIVTTDDGHILVSVDDSLVIELVPADKEWSSVEILRRITWKLYCSMTEMSITYTEMFMAYFHKILLSPFAKRAGLPSLRPQQWGIKAKQILRGIYKGILMRYENSPILMLNLVLLFETVTFKFDALRRDFNVTSFKLSPCVQEVSVTKCCSRIRGNCSLRISTTFKSQQTYRRTVKETLNDVLETSTEAVGPVIRNGERIDHGLCYLTTSGNRFKNGEYKSGGQMQETSPASPHRTRSSGGLGLDSRSRCPDLKPPVHGSTNRSVPNDLDIDETFSSDSSDLPYKRALFTPLTPAGCVPVPVCATPIRVKKAMRVPDHDSLSCMSVTCRGDDRRDTGSLLMQSLARDRVENIFHRNLCPETFRFPATNQTPPRVDMSHVCDSLADIAVTVKGSWSAECTSFGTFLTKVCWYKQTREGTQNALVLDEPKTLVQRIVCLSNRDRLSQRLPCPLSSNEWQFHYSAMSSRRISRRLPQANLRPRCSLHIQPLGPQQHRQHLRVVSRKQPGLRKEMNKISESSCITANRLIAVACPMNLVYNNADTVEKYCNTNTTTDKQALNNEQGNILQSQRMDGGQFEHLMSNKVLWASLDREFDCYACTLMPEVVRCMGKFPILYSGNANRSHICSLMCGIIRQDLQQPVEPIRHPSVNHHWMHDGRTKFGCKHLGWETDERMTDGRDGLLIADLPWRSRLVCHRPGVWEALGSNPGQDMDQFCCAFHRPLRKTVPRTPLSVTDRRIGVRCFVNRAQSRSARSAFSLPSTALLALSRAVSRAAAVSVPVCYRRAAVSVKQVALQVATLRRCFLAHCAACLREPAEVTPDVDIPASVPSTELSASPLVEGEMGLPCLQVVPLVRPGTHDELHGPGPPRCKATMGPAGCPVTGLERFPVPCVPGLKVDSQPSVSHMSVRRCARMIPGDRSRSTGRSETGNVRSSKSAKGDMDANTSNTNTGAPVSLLASHQGDPGSIPGRVTPSCRTMPLVGGFSRGSPVPPARSFWRCSKLTSITLIGSRDLRRRRKLTPVFLARSHREEQTHPCRVILYQDRHAPIGYAMKTLKQCNVKVTARNVMWNCAQRPTTVKNFRLAASNEFNPFVWAGTSREIQSHVVSTPLSCLRLASATFYTCAYLSRDSAFHIAYVLPLSKDMPRVDFPMLEFLATPAEPMGSEDIGELEVWWTWQMRAGVPVGLRSSRVSGHRAAIGVSLIQLGRGTVKPVPTENTKCRSINENTAGNRRFGLNSWFHTRLPTFVTRAFHVTARATCCDVTPAPGQAAYVARTKATKKTHTESRVGNNDSRESIAARMMLRPLNPTVKLQLCVWSSSTQIYSEVLFCKSLS
ncbi:hypothetical protein PR048_016904 [Dryococelus australis]|uniref:Uncharacterized protein n=1 Tax=Dryococelus australis TaxID=614101 RepID=A0ABQ9H890_9NEOP|nr:hypothetical protein PR048_016904 [Dryococelus australis]